GVAVEGERLLGDVGHSRDLCLRDMSVITKRRIEFRGGPQQVQQIRYRRARIVDFVGGGGGQTSRRSGPPRTAYVLLRSPSLLDVEQRNDRPGGDLIGQTKPGRAH